MKPRTELSMKLYHYMLDLGYPEEFCDIITRNLNTDFTAKRMIGYLRQFSAGTVDGVPSFKGKKPSLEIVADEMLAILDDRARIMQKKDLEEINASWNEFLRFGFEEQE